MYEVNLPQADADALLAMEKHRVDETQYNFPVAGDVLKIHLQSPDKREAFILDISRSQLVLSKGKYQNRAKGVLILARLDFGGAPHRNPNDTEIECPHIHLYREGFGDKWAFPLEAAVFHDPSDSWQLFEDFMRYVNITRPPHVLQGLFK